MRSGISRSRFAHLPTRGRHVRVDATLKGVLGLLGGTDVEARCAALLVLDDLGREKISDWTGELVYSLINSRYEGRLLTVATSNLTPVELRASGYWTAISRLAEDGALVDITAPDRRLRR